MAYIIEILNRKLLLLQPSHIKIINQINSLLRVESLATEIKLNPYLLLILIIFFSENILIKDDQVKLADFGSCRGVYS